MANLAEVLVDTLAQAGVERVYGLPGDSANAITDSLRKHPKIQWVHMRIEEAAAFAAGAEAHLTDRIAVVLGSCGPGNLHFINGLYDCHRSRVPVLAIATQIPSTELGTTYFQETHPEKLFADCADYIGVISESAHMPRVLAIAMRTAIANRSVAVVVMSGDVALRKATSPPIELGFLRNQSAVMPAEADLDYAAKILNAAEKITILAGAGCAHARRELLAMAEHLKAPIVHALRGKEFIEYDNPYDVGMTGLLGFSSGYRAMMHCDALLAVGTDFPYPQFFPEKAKKIQIDHRGSQIGRRTPVDVGLIGTAEYTLPALAAKVVAKNDNSHLNDSLAHYRSARKSLDEWAVAKEGQSPLHPEWVMRVVSDTAAENAVFTVDVGTPCIWAARYLKFNGSRRMVGSFAHGSMANALPQALGAQAVARERQVISLSGDGGLAMLMGELLTAVQNKLPVKIIVFNNHALAFVEVEMMAAGIDPYGTDLQNPDFSAVAQACGLYGARVTKPEELQPALEAAFAHDGPALVDVHVHRRELSMPPTITAEQAGGFSLYLMKCVLSGKGDEIEDLAKTNLLGLIFGEQ